MTDFALPTSFRDPAVLLYFGYLSVPLRRKTRQDERRQNEARRDEARRSCHYGLGAPHRVAETVGSCVATSPTLTAPSPLTPSCWEPQDVAAPPSGRRGQRLGATVDGRPHQDARTEDDKTTTVDRADSSHLKSTQVLRGACQSPGRPSILLPVTRVSPSGARTRRDETRQDDARHSGLGAPRRVVITAGGQWHQVLLDQPTFAHCDTITYSRPLWPPNQTRGQGLYQNKRHSTAGTITSSQDKSKWTQAKINSKNSVKTNMSLRGPCPDRT